jgi:predicted phage terminase large subunit-like protein
MTSKTKLINEIELVKENHRRNSINSLYYTLRLFWDVIIQDEFIDNWHIKYICEELEKISQKVIERKEKDYDLIINIPPGTSKSTIITIMWDVWLWLQDPSIVVISSSYSSGLSTDHSIKFSSIVHSDLFNELFQPYYISEFGKRFEFAKDTESIITNNFGGSRIATSTGGTITGKHAHIIKRDDPLDPEQAESKAYRERASRFNDRTLSSRKKQKESTVTVTVMQRLHQSDTTGLDLQKDKKVKHICLPAEISDKITPQHLKDNYVDGLLDPVRLSSKILQESKQDLGTYGYSGQYMQNPVPEGGGKIKRDWFEFINESDLPPVRFDLWIDGAYTKNTENDPSGFMIAGEYRGILYIKHAVSKHMDMPECLKFIPEYCNLHRLTPLSKIYIEPKATGLSLIQMLKANTRYNPVKIRSKLVTEGKESRIQTAAPKVESGRVVLVNGSWNDNFISELIGFPNMEHDEFVDLLGYSCYKYFDSTKKKPI